MRACATCKWSLALELWTLALETGTRAPNTCSLFPAQRAPAVVILSERSERKDLLLIALRRSARNARGAVHRSPSWRSARNALGRDPRRAYDSGQPLARNPAGASHAERAEERPDRGDR
jgi:hypothetical protein